MLEEEPENAGIRLQLVVFLRGMLRLLGECEWEVKGVVVQSMGQTIGLTKCLPSMSRKWVRALITLWA
jgi:hypothetical protein